MWEVWEVREAWEVLVVLEVRRECGIWKVLAGGERLGLIEASETYKVSEVWEVSKDGKDGSYGSCTRSMGGMVDTEKNVG